MLKRDEIREPEPFPFDDLADRDGDLRAELRAPEAERVELAPLAARIDPGRKLRQEVSSYCRPAKRRSTALGPRRSGPPRGRRQHPRASAGVSRRSSRSGTAARCPCLPGPHPVLPDVIEEQVAERHVVTPATLASATAARIRSS